MAPDSVRFSLRQLCDFLEITLEGELGTNASTIWASGASQDSRMLSPGDIYIGLTGDKFRGADLVNPAAEAGAVAAIVDSPVSKVTTLPVVVVEGLRGRLGQIANFVFRTSASQMRLFGVTGTNGKTTTTTYLYRLLQLLGISVGLSASHVRVTGGMSHSSSLTTPECLELHRALREMRIAGETSAAVEVSAHALVRNRVDGIVFEVAGFTNLARDHLDDFGTMENYRAAKLLLFTPEHSKRAVIHVNSEHGNWVLENARVPKVSIGKGMDWEFGTTDGTFSLSRGEKVELTRDWSGSSIMAQNLAVATVMLLEAGFSVSELREVLSQLDLLVPGRLEKFEVPAAGVTVFLDYAHTPAAVSAAVEALSEFQDLTVILGASGNRDQGKRPEMGFAAGAANRVIVTDQHPRDESPEKIRAAVERGALMRLPSDSVHNQADPSAAFELALKLAKREGAILWCGPGNLDYREVNGQKVPFSARETILKSIKNA